MINSSRRICIEFTHVILFISIKIFVSLDKSNHKENNVKHILSTILYIILSVATGLLIYLGVKQGLQPPIWTGVGFIAIVGLLLVRKK